MLVIIFTSTLAVVISKHSAIVVVWLTTVLSADIKLFLLVLCSASDHVLPPSPLPCLSIPYRGVATIEATEAAASVKIFWNQAWVLKPFLKINITVCLHACNLKHNGLLFQGISMLQFWTSTKIFIQLKNWDTLIEQSVLVKLVKYSNKAVTKRLPRKVH